MRQFAPKIFASRLPDNVSMLLSRMVEQTPAERLPNASRMGAARRHVLSWPRREN